MAKKVGKILRVSCNAIKDLGIVKKSIDARDKENVFYLFSLKFDVENEDKYLKLKMFLSIRKFHTQFLKINVSILLL